MMLDQELRTKILDKPDNSAKNADTGCHHLCQWPIKITKISSTAPYFHKAHLLLTADCVAYSYENFRKSLGDNKVLVIGCPDLEIAEMALKLTEILRLNDILSITVMRMDTLCCKQITQSIFVALRNSGKDVPLHLITVFLEGELIE